MNTDERLTEMANATQQLAQTVARLELNNQERGEQVPNVERSIEDNTFRIHIAEFGGTSHNPEDYLEWEAGIERYFELKETPKAQQYQLARIKLTKLVAIWLEGV